MKRYVISLCILLTSVMGQAQHRTYIETDREDMRRDVYVTRGEDEQLYLHLQLWNCRASRDSVFVVLGETECREMREALCQLKATYYRWSSSARAHKVKDYIRPVEIKFPKVVFQWRTTEDVFGKELYERDCRRTEHIDFPQPYFKVDKEGRCYMIFEASLYDYEDGSKPYGLSLLFASSYDFNELIKRCNFSRAASKYERLNQNRTEAFYDSVFR